MVRSLDRKRASRRSEALQVKMNTVLGGKFVASSLESRDICAASVILSASSINIRCILHPCMGTYWHVRRILSMFSRLHSCEGTWCSSAGIAAASASAIVVLPVPDGPIKSHADGNGFAASLERIFLGFSSPTKESI